MFSFFKKKKVVPHIKLSGVIGNVGKFKQGIDFSGQEEIIKKAFSIKKAPAVAISINSPGGSVTAGMSIYDTMQFIKPDVSTMCIGQAASMGAFLLSAGTKGKRLALPHSRIMIHQPLGGTAQRQASDIEIEAREILRIKETLNKSMADMTGQTFEKIEKDTDRDYFLSAEEAKNYGLIDRVITHPSES